MKAPFRLYLDGTRRRIVKHSDATAAYLLANVGDELEKKYESQVLAMVKPDAIVAAPVVQIAEPKKSKKFKL